MSSVDYEALESEIEAVSEEEHQRRLRAFTERLAQKMGLLDEARSSGARDGRSQGLSEGRAETTRRHLLQTLERRQLAIGDRERERITAAPDPDQLDRWFENALTAASVADVFGDETGLL